MIKRNRSRKAAPIASRSCGRCAGRGFFYAGGTIAGTPGGPAVFSQTRVPCPTCRSGGEIQCAARREQDEMVCNTCHLRWDASDPRPPSCDPHNISK